MNSVVLPANTADDVASLAKRYSLKYLIDRGELEGRSLHPNRDLLEAAKDKGLLLLDNGLLLITDPSRQQDLMNIRNMASRLNIQTFICLTTQNIIDTFYDAESFAIEHEESADEEDVDFENDSQTIRRLEDLISEGVRETSDLHIEIRKRFTNIRHRILGDLEDVGTLTEAAGRAIANVAFRVKANKDFNLKEPQQGSFTQFVLGREVRLRINYQPCVDGGDVVIRYLSTGVDKEIPPLSSLGYDKIHEHIFDSAMRRGSGVILISGPTGSGKTTTLASLLSTVPRIRKVYTMEDPVEQIIKNATQISISSNADDQEGLAKLFKAYQKNIMRQDPDVAMLGEIRDLDVGSTMIQMALTGHIALGTIHTNSGIAILTRLNDMGISWQRLADPGLIRALAYQRLTPCLCENCKLPLADISDAHPYIKDASNHAAYQRIHDFLVTASFEGIYTRNPNGCENCGGNGRTGRTVVAEIIQVDNQGRQHIREGDMLAYRNYLASMGWENITEHALRLVKAGRVDPFEVDSIAGPIGAVEDEDAFSYTKQKEKLSQVLRSNMKVVEA